jgi:hypothetical protein
MATIMDLATGAWAARALCVAAELGVADRLKDGPRSAGDLGAALGVSQDALYRVLRYLAGQGVFEERAGRTFALTPAGELLRADHPGSLRAIAMMTSRPWDRRSWERLDHSVRTGRTATPEAFGTDVWGYFRDHPDDADNFNAAMTGLSAHEHAAAVEAYDFTGIARLCDVGGGHGRLLGLALRTNPSMQGVLFDQPQVVAGAAPVLGALGVADRVEAVGGSFFEKVPSGCDAYMMAHIIHDWDDAHAGKILACCRREMAPGGRLLLFESVLGPPNVPEPAKLLDLEMLVVAGGRERTEAEFAALVAAHGFRLARVVPAKGPMSVVECKAV